MNKAAPFYDNDYFLRFNDDERTEYLEKINDDKAIFHCEFSLVYFSHIPDMDRNEPQEFQNLYIEAGRRTLRKYEAIYAFYDKHGLSRTPLCNTTGEIIKDPVYEGDLTEEGVRFVEIAKHWRETKGAAKNPPDTKYLERKLKAMREQ